MSKLGLIDIWEQTALGEGANLLLVVDQFEELFLLPAIGGRREHREGRRRFREPAPGGERRGLATPSYTITRDTTLTQIRPSARPGWDLSRTGNLDAASVTKKMRPVVLRPGFETLGWGYSGSQF